jgi:TetR/AcrR family transcriptional regulator, transcriptional repressor for nem operon
VIGGGGASLSDRGAGPPVWVIGARGAGLAIARRALVSAIGRWTATLGSVTDTAAPRTKPAAVRRKDLLDAGLALFAERGIARTTVSEIAQRAGVAQGTFYLHFPSKDALLFALQDRFEERIVERARAAIDRAGPDWGARLDACVLACFEDYERELGQHDVLFAHIPADASRRNGGSHLGRGLTAVIADLLAQGSAAGAFDVADLDVTALLLFSALHGGFDEFVHVGPAVAKERLVPALLELFRRTAGCAPRTA